jgi:magnesium chelatase subunit D
MSVTNRSEELSITKLINQQKSLKMPSTAAVYPFTAIVSQEEMKLAMLLNVIDDKVGGVLIMGHRGTGKSTAVRALVDLLPDISVAVDCVYRCDPVDQENSCDQCRQAIAQGARLRSERAAVRVVELPLGATEDRVCGTIDIEQALRSGTKRFEPGLLARANRGFLYIDEVNLLEDHLVDLLLDVSTTGINNVEREGVSVRHPARFILIGSGNPEEGELRPQLLDRFGLYVEVTTEDELDRRVEIVERREAFESDAQRFQQVFAESQDDLRRRITRARKGFRSVKVERGLIRNIARVCTELKIDGHRGELTITRAARALAAFEGRRKVSDSDVRRVAVMALRHRLRRDALEDVASVQRIEQTLNHVFGESRSAGAGENGGDDGLPPGARHSSAKQDPLHSAANPDALSGRNGNSAGKASAGPKGKVGADAPATQVSGANIPAGREIKIKLPRPPIIEAKLKSDRSQGDGSNRSIFNQQRGRYARSVNSTRASGKIALDATLRAAASSISTNANPRDARRAIPADALRYKLFKRKQGRLFLFAIDLSGSMALNRIHHAREVIFGLLRRSYIQRDSVAIVGFRGLTANVMLPPTKSMLRARRVLETLPMGGGTPLCAGLARALELAKRAQRNSGEMVLMLFTDGGANVPLRAFEKTNRSARRSQIENEVRRLGDELKNGAIALVVVDTQKAFGSSGDALAIAESLGATYVRAQEPRHTSVNLPGIQRG